MQLVHFEKLTKWVLDLYHLKLKHRQPEPLDDYGVTPMWLGNGFFQMDDNLPAILSLHTKDRRYGLMVYYIHGSDTWCYIEVHGPDGTIAWDALPFDIRWDLWRLLHHFYPQDTMLYPPRLAEYITERLYDHGHIASKRKKRRIRSDIERSLRLTCPIYRAV